MGRLVFLSGLVLSLACSQVFAACESPENEIVGHWLFYKIIHKGEERPPYNPNLVLEYLFRADGTDTLRWSRRNEKGLCERKGQYQFNGTQILDKVTWVNPNNSMDCGADPDMQLGRETVTEAAIKNGELHTLIPVGDDVLFYVWKKVDDSSKRKRRSR